MARRSVASRTVALASLLAAAGASGCARPATFGAHVLYNATFVHGAHGEARHLPPFTLLHAVAGGDAIGARLAGWSQSDAW